MTTTAVIARPQSAMKTGVFTITMDTSYSAGGEPVSFAGFKRPIAVVVTGCSSTGFVGRYNLPTRTMQVFRGDYPNVAAGPLLEVPATTNLTGTVFTVLVVGIQ